MEEELVWFRAKTMTPETVEKLAEELVSQGIPMNVDMVRYRNQRYFPVLLSSLPEGRLVFDTVLYSRS